MKLIIATLMFAALAAAQTVTVNVSITVPTAVAQKISDWRAKQVDAEGNPKYASNQDLLKSHLRELVKRILEQEPTAAMLAEQAKIDTAKAAIEAAKDSVQ